MYYLRLIGMVNSVEMYDMNKVDEDWVYPGGPLVSPLSLSFPVKFFFLSALAPNKARVEAIQFQ